MDRLDHDAVEVAPVGPGRFQDLAALFEARGGPHYCWCSLYRKPPERSATKEEKKGALRQRVLRDQPVGVLAYLAGEPAGWCSVAPREAYGRLERSAALRRGTSQDIPTWAILCFFVPRKQRGKGLARALLAGAIDFARAGGAEVVEAFPYDTAGSTATHRGHSSLFKAAGFRQDGARWYLPIAGD